MKTKVLITLGLVLVVAVIAAVAAYIFMPHGAVSIGMSDAGKTVTLSEGGILEVSLAGNLTTGYTWEALPVDPSLITQVGEPVMKPDTNALGSGGTITIKFQAVQKGQAQLMLVYHRPWEKDVAPIQTFEVTIVVK